MKSVACLLHGCVLHQYGFGLGRADYTWCLQQDWRCTYESGQPLRQQRGLILRAGISYAAENLHDLTAATAVAGMKSFHHREQ